MTEDTKKLLLAYVAELNQNDAMKAITSIIEYFTDGGVTKAAFSVWLDGQEAKLNTGILNLPTQQKIASDSMNAEIAMIAVVKLEIV